MKVGSVPYLNAEPLVKGLRENGTEILRLPPAELAPTLRSHQVDIALVPLMEVLSASLDYQILNGLGVGCDGPVFSVILKLHNSPKSLQTLNPIEKDPHSVSSNALLEVLLKENGNECFQWSHETEAAPEASLVIGDPALQHRHDFPEAPVIDLGEAWKELTGLPFVFAVWAIHPQANLSHVELDQFRKHSAVGLEGREQLTSDPVDQTYLTKYIHYDLGEAQRQAIYRFEELLIKNRLIALPKQPTFI